MYSIFNAIFAFLFATIFFGGLTYFVVLPEYGWTKVSETWKVGFWGFLGTLPVASVKKLFRCIKMPMYGSSVGIGFTAAKATELFDGFWVVLWAAIGAIVGIVLYIRYRKAGLFRPGQLGEAEVVPVGAPSREKPAP